MARPQDKDTLLLQAQHSYAQLTDLIDTLSLEEQQGVFPFVDRDKNIRDVLIHLYEWHQLLLDWVHANYQKDTITAFFPAPYNWKTYGQLNLEFWQKHQTTSLDEAKKNLSTSHNEVLALIDSFSNEALFTKKYFHWTNTTTLGSYCVSATSSHYQWAIKKIKRYLKEK